MCGLFGFSSTVPIKRMPQLMIQLAIYNEERGKQSWGVYNGKELIKDEGPISRALYRIPYADKGVLMGHTRAATVGDVNKENAHPFLFDSSTSTKPVVGAHNGCIYNHNELNKKHGWNLQVDSMQIFKHIAEGLALDDIEGYGAITFVKEGCLYFSRFNGGSLSIAQIEGGGLVWSSDEFALNKALVGANLNNFMYKVEEGRIYYFSKNKLFDSEEDIAITTTHKRNQMFPRSRSYHDSQWDTSNNRQQVKSSNSNIISRRMIKLRIIKPSFTADTPPLTAEQEKLEDIKVLLFKNKELCTDSEKPEDCMNCRAKTTRLLFGKNPMCLSCMADMVAKGELVVADGKPDEVVNA